MSSPLPARRRALVVLVAAALAAGACGSGGDTGPRALPPRALEADALPADILGLSVHPEDVSKQLASVPAGYADAVGLFTLRHDEKLMATLEVVRLNATARVEEADFRERMVSQVGGTAPRRLDVEGRTVWLTFGAKERTAAWFDARTFYLLTTRADYERPRRLLRAVLHLEGPR